MPAFRKDTKPESASTFIVTWSGYFLRCSLLASPL